MTRNMRHLFTILLSAALISCSAQNADDGQNVGLAAMRAQIDTLDNQLLHILAQRLNVCVEVGKYKKEHNIEVVQPNRFNEILERQCKAGKALGLSEDFVKKIMNTIHDESVQQQEKLKADSCTEGTSSASKVTSVELLKTSQSWDGVDLPDYLKGKPELRVLKVVVPPHSALGKHHHDVMSYGVVNTGHLTLVREEDGKEITVNPGEAVVETVGTVHHGENRGDDSVEVIVFYLSKENLPLSVSDE